MPFLPNQQRLNPKLTDDQVLKASRHFNTWFLMADNSPNEDFFLNGFKDYLRESIGLNNDQIEECHKECELRAILYSYTKGYRVEISRDEIREIIERFQSGMLSRTTF